MKKCMKMFIAAWLPLVFWGQPGLLFCDNIMVCAFFVRTEARVYRVSDEGDISFSYKLDVTEGAEPVALKFSPDGKWGLVGCNTGKDPKTQTTTVLKIDNNRNISVSGFVHNEHLFLVTISPDSKYGVFGNYLQTVIYNPDDTYTSNTENQEFLASYYADFSSLNGRLIARRTSTIINEYYINQDGRVVFTGFSMDISPSSGNQDLEVSPDGKTCIVLSNGLEITVLRIKEQGGFSLVEQFDITPGGAQEVDYTPDSKYAIIVGTYIRSFEIQEDSKLNEVSVVKLPELHTGEDMAVTPDGKYAVTRMLINDETHFYVVRIKEDGTLEYLPEKDYVCKGHVSAIAFVPPRKDTGVSWMLR